LSVKTQTYISAVESIAHCTTLLFESKLIMK